MRKYRNYTIRLGNIQFLSRGGQRVPSRKAQIVGITLSDAKNNQYGRGEVRYHHKSGNPVLCPVKAAKWIRKGASAFGTPASELALSTRGGGINSSELSAVIKGGAAKAGFDPTGCRSDLWADGFRTPFEDVLKTHFETFDKGPRAITILRDLLGDGIFAVDGSKWVHQRKTASNLFSLRSLRESMTESVQKHGLVLNKILNQAAQANKSIDLFSLLNRFTIEAFAEIGFGVELGALDAETEHPFQAAFDRAQRILKRRAARPPLFWKTQRLLNLGAERELKASIRTIDDTVFGIIQKSLANRASRAHSTPESSSTSGKKDIVSLFLDNVSSNTSSSGSFDPVFLRDIVVNFLIAGRDTTAQALSWFFYCLSQNPDVETKIRNEIASKLPDLVSGRIQTPSMEQTNELLYLEATLRETLRLYPSVPANVKQANKDVVLSDGSFIKKGQAVIISSYLLARMTHVWGADAKQFKPERWIDAETGKMISMTSFKFPAFHAGPRLCLGMNLAMMEMKIIASMVLSKFHLELVAGQHITYDYSLTLPFRSELKMRITPIA
ncbi:Cytochrome p450, partial [Globisporangium splendens]